MRMADQFKGTLKSDSESPLQLRSLYATTKLSICNSRPSALRGDFGIVKSDDKLTAKQDALYLLISSMGETKQIGVMGGKGVVNEGQDNFRWIGFLFKIWFSKKGIAFFN